VQVSVGPTFIRVQNGNQPLAAMALDVLGSDGRHHSYQVPGALHPLESAEVALDAFVPPIGDGSLTEVNVFAIRSDGARYQQAIPTTRQLLRPGTTG
jgi:hypothetical protein